MSVGTRRSTSGHGIGVVMVDRNGILNAATLDLATNDGWQGPDTIGNLTLIPGSPVTILQQSPTVFTALMVDRNGILNAATLDLATNDGWQGPDTIGNLTLIPGSPVTILQQSPTVFTALMVDRNGILNAATLDLATNDGWQGPDTIGNLTLIPGSPVTILQQSPTVFTALMVDRNGILNAATLDLATNDGWQGPDTIGNLTLVPGSPVTPFGTAGAPTPAARAWTLLSAESSVHQPQFDRAGHSAVYVPAAKRMVVFGGFKLGELSLMDDVEVLSDADGIGDDPRWITLLEPGTPGGPSPRGNHSAIYDAASDRMVVFGGTTGVQTFAGDVWALADASGEAAPSAWTQLRPREDGPGPRFAHSAVHQPTGDRMLVFGGSAGAAPLDDVWVLEGATGVAGDPAWTRLDPHGTRPALWGHSAVYDPACDAMTVFGGSTSPDGDTLSNAVWVLVGAGAADGKPAWSRLQVEDGPAPRVQPTAVLDAENDAMIVFGGVDPTGTVFFDDLWILSGISTDAPAWNQIRPVGRAPAPRVAHTAVYDDASRRMIVYGGGSDEGNFFSIWVLA